MNKTRFRLVYRGFETWCASSTREAGWDAIRVLHSAPVGCWGPSKNTSQIAILGAIVKEGSGVLMCVPLAEVCGSGFRGELGRVVDEATRAVPDTVQAVPLVAWVTPTPHVG